MIASDKFWYMLENILRLKNPFIVYSEEKSLLAKIGAEKIFKKAAFRTHGEIIYGDNYRDFLRFQIVDWLQKFIDKEIGNNG